MTNEAREAIASHVMQPICKRCDSKGCRLHFHPAEPCVSIEEEVSHITSRILSLKYPTGEDMIVIQDIDQKLPALPPLSSGMMSLTAEMQELMVNEGWRKVVRDD